MSKKSTVGLAMAIFLLITAGLTADEMALRVTPFTPTELEAAQSEQKVAVFEEINRHENYPNLLDLKEISFDKYGILLKFQREDGRLKESRGRFAYAGFFKPAIEGESRQKDAKKIIITRYKHVLFDDVLGITCGKLKKYGGKKIRGKGFIVTEDQEAGEAVTILQLKNGDAVYFESTAAQAVKLANNLKLLTRKQINAPSTLGLGVEVSPDSGRVITVIDGTLLGKVPLYSKLLKIDSKKLKAKDASVAAKVARNGAILTFRSEKIKILASKSKKIEIRVKREGK